MSEIIRVRLDKNEWAIVFAISNVPGINQDNKRVADGTENVLELEVLDGFQRSQIIAQLGEINNLTVLSGTENSIPAE